MNTTLQAKPIKKTEGGQRRQKIVNSSMPLISVITIVFNGASSLEQAILSVLNQDYPNIDYIVIDGGSTDGTLDIIRKYEDQIDYWISEPDAGISAAFNKGISQCRGAIIGTLNADDTYLPGTIRLVAESLVGEGAGRIIHGTMIGETKKSTTVIKPRPFPNLFFYFDTPYYHPTTFIPTSVYEKIGGYNTEYQYAMDYDLFLRAHKAGVSFHCLPTAITRYSFSGKSGSNPIAAYREVLMSQRENGLFVPLCMMFFVLKKVVNLLKKYLI